MSIRDLETVERAFEAFERGDLDAILPLIDPEFEIGDEARRAAGLED